MTTLITKALSELIVLRHELQSTFDNLKTLQHENNSLLELGDTLDSIESEIDRIDYTKVLSISFNTGTYVSKVIHFLGDENSDILALIDDYAAETDCQLCFYEASEVLSYEDDYIDESFLPINGGACYTDAVISANENIVYTIMALKDGIL